MATFDEKEFLYDVYNSVRICISKAKGYDNEYTECMLKDIKNLQQFKNEIINTPHEDIDYQQALKFFKNIENKYQ